MVGSGPSHHTIFARSEYDFVPARAKTPVAWSTGVGPAELHGRGPRRRGGGEAALGAPAGAPDHMGWTPQSSTSLGTQPMQSQRKLSRMATVARMLSDMSAR